MTDEHDENEKTPIVVPEGTSADTRFLITHFDRKIDGVYQRIESVRDSWARGMQAERARVDTIASSLTACQSEHRGREEGVHIVEAQVVAKKDLRAKYAAPLLATTVGAAIGFVLSHIVGR